MHSFLQLLLFLVVDLLCVLNLLVLIAKFLEFLLCKLQLVTVTVYLVLALFNLAVVGPNGSGKSNLIESLLFVFGKRAKQMRLNKLSELIHKSAEHPDVPQASVRVSFQEILDHENDPDYFEVIPGTKFTVSRQVTKSSTSRYYINNQMTDYTTVCNVLKQKGIDLDHNRFLILQGEVEQISLMKPKAANPNETGLLEYLEDIIGSNKFVEEIETLSRVCEECNERRIE